MYTFLPAPLALCKLLLNKKNITQEQKVVVVTNIGISLQIAQSPEASIQEKASLSFFFSTPLVTLDPF